MGTPTERGRCWTRVGLRFGDGPVDTLLLPPGPRRYDEPTPLASRPPAK